MDISPFCRAVALPLVLVGLFVLALVLALSPEPATALAACVRYLAVLGIAALGVLALRLAHRSVAAPAPERRDDEPPEFPRLAG